MILKDLVIATNVRSKLHQTFTTTLQRRCREKPVKEYKNDFIEKKATCIDSLSLLTNTKNSYYWFAGPLGKTLQRFFNLCLQQRYLRH